jgi:hypothetical protein
MASTASWQLPAGWQRVGVQRWGPFVVRELVRRPDGQVIELSSRRHRKGRRAAPGPAQADAAAVRPHAVVWAPREIGWWVGVLFIIGSSCFAVGSLPMLSSAVPSELISTIYFIGSLFFTSAAYLQYVEAINPNGVGGGAVRRWIGVRPRGVGWWAAAVQLVGTLLFNVTTFAALHTEFTVHQQNLRIWSPDFFGSICFLVASAFAIGEIRAPDRRGWRWHEISWRLVWLNMLGSIFFMASAIAAFVRPATEELLSASIANAGTLLGALCFLWGAWLLLVELAAVPDSAPAPVQRSR